MYLSTNGKAGRERDRNSEVREKEGGERGGRERERREKRERERERHIHMYVLKEYYTPHTCNKINVHACTYSPTCRDGQASFMLLGLHSPTRHGASGQTRRHGALLCSSIPYHPHPSPPLYQTWSPCWSRGRRERWNSATCFFSSCWPTWSTACPLTS